MPHDQYAFTIGSECTYNQVFPKVGHIANICQNCNGWIYRWVNRWIIFLLKICQRFGKVLQGFVKIILNTW